MKSRILKATIATIGAVALAWGTVSPASAEEVPPPAETTQTAQLTPTQTAEIESLVAAIDPATRVFHADEALSAGVPESAVADFAATYEAAGQTVSDLSSATKSKITESGKQIAAKAAACTGRRGYTGFWGWGWQFALNSCDTDLLIATVAGAGTSYAAIGALISAAGVTAPAGAVTIAIGGIIAAGAGPLNICKAASYGKRAIYINAYVGGGIGCWGQ